MNNPQEAIQVAERFFQALNMIISKKQLRGVKTFTRLYGINNWNFVTMRANKETSFLKPEYLTYLVRDFNISANWLLTGEGEMFKK